MQSLYQSEKSEMQITTYSVHKLDRITKQETFKKKHSLQFQSLTSREFEIFNLLVHDYNNPQIALKLSISRKTVEQHRKNINRKLDTHTFMDIYSYALAFDVV